MEGEKTNLNYKVSPILVYLLKKKEAGTTKQFIFAPNVWGCRHLVPETAVFNTFP